MLKASDVLFRAGDQGSDMFVLQSGELACINLANEQVAVLKAGAYRQSPSLSRRMSPR